MKCKLLVIFQLLIYLCVILCKKSTNIPPVFYISYSQPIAVKSSFGSYVNNSINNTDNININTYNSYVLQLLLNSDDSPFESVSLPWSFNYFGKDLKTLYANPNGAFHISMKQPCQSCSCFGNYQGCNLNVSYYGVIAGFLTDLYPYGSNSSIKNITITRVKGDTSDYQSLNPLNQLGYTDSIMLNFVNIRGYSSLPKNNTFTIQLLQDSSIVISYFNFSTIKGVEYITGLRSPNNYLQNQFTITQDQIKTGISQWSTNVSGIYPQYLNDLSPGNRFVACPLSTFWCIRNSSLYFPISKPDSWLISIELTTISLSCVNNVLYYLYISEKSSNMTESDNKSINALYLCQSNLPNVLFCNISDWIQNVIVTTSYTVYVDVYWTIPLQSTAARLAITSIPLYINIDKQLSEGPAYLSGVCSENMNIGNCSLCAICESNYTCLNLHCNDENSLTSEEIFSEENGIYDQSTSYLLEMSLSETNPYIYEYIVCNDSCSSEYLYNSNLSYPIASCCLESDTDCNGQCFGPAVIAFNSVGALMCCLNGDVDCLDVCGGSAKRDACGTCQGTDFTAKGCQSLVAIETAWIDNNLYPNISLSTANYSETVYLNITNGNATAITISFSLTSKDNSNNGPDVYIPQGEYQLLGHSNSLYYLNVSYYHLVTGKQIDWEVKQIQVTYNFINNNDYMFNRILYIYPSSYNCNAIVSYYACARLPTCLFCINKYSSIRLLTISNFSNSYESNSKLIIPDSLNRSDGRVLYANIIPNGYDSPDIDWVNLPGSCVDSHYQPTCQIGSSHRSAMSAVMIAIVTMTIGLYLNN